MKSIDWMTEIKAQFPTGARDFSHLHTMHSSFARAWSTSIPVENEVPFLWM
jgi:hypothetical protein